MSISFMLQENFTDDEKIANLLDTWNVATFLDVLQGNCQFLKFKQNSYYRIIFQDNCITYARLKRLEGNDYNTLVKDHKYRLGEMVDLRIFHREWKKTLVNKKPIVV